MFSGPVPPLRLHVDFIKEIADFVAAHRHELGSRDVAYWRPIIATPLMVEYLQVLYLRVDRVCRMAFQSHRRLRGDAGYLHGRGYCGQKDAKNFRPADELWLAIQCSTRISETLLPIGANDFDMVLPLAGFRFSRVFVLTFLGLFQWKAAEGWRKLTGEPDAQFSAATTLSV